MSKMRVHRISLIAHTAHRVLANRRDKNVYAEVYKPFNDQDITPVGSAWGLGQKSSGGVATAADASPTAALHLRHRYYISLMNERK
jgi:hypothetical protein